MENNPHVVPSTENTKPRHFGDGSQFPPLQRPWEGRRLGTPELQALLFCSRGLNSAVGPQLTAVCKPLKPLPGNIPSYRTPLAEQLTERPQHTGEGLLLLFTAKAGGAGHPSPPGVKLPQFKQQLWGSPRRTMKSPVMPGRRAEQEQVHAWDQSSPCCLLSLLTSLTQNITWGTCSGRCSLYLINPFKQLRRVRCLICKCLKQNEKSRSLLFSTDSDDPVSKWPT